MKLKKQFDRIGGNRLNEAQMIHGVDYSTLKLKSNIDQKWRSVEDMTSDMGQWMEASYKANGEEAMEDIAIAMEGVLKWSRSIVDKKDDPNFTDDEEEFYRR